MALTARDARIEGELTARFADLALLREGSQFSVYAGRDRASGRLVAVKLPDESRPTWVHTALREQARILADLGGQPHIITLRELLELSDGRPALVLDRCATTLAESLRLGGRVDVGHAAGIGIKLARALEAVHAAGLVHCDVRPDNVLVTDEGEPVLGAFDEAVSLAAAPTTSQHVLTAHTAPEVLEGATPSPATDVYGLAATLYELIAGQAAFREYVGESPATVIVRVLSGQVRPIVADGVPLELSDLLTWAMSPDPTRRPPSPAWLAEELSRISAREGWPRPMPVPQA